jgi:murein DD-endopeptidase MepM/ murein hydrolase activator NlpD
VTVLSGLFRTIRNVSRTFHKRSVVGNVVSLFFALLVFIALPGLFFARTQQVEDPAATDVLLRQLADPEDSVGLVDFSELSGLDAVSGLSEFMEEAPPDEGLFYRVHKMAAGDTISHIAQQYGVSTDSIITFNDVRNARTIQIGALLKIPNMNGILHEIRKGDTIEALAKSYAISADRISEVNKLDGDALVAGRHIFLPDARMSSIALREINGDLFAWPLRSYITSWYGWRNDPFTGRRAFHTGIDIGAPNGTSVRAAMDGVVRSTGYSATMGNYIILAHHSGYSTLYAHLSSILVRTGARVSTTTVIGRVGNTGYSTGPHLHFTVWKNGITVNPMTLMR